MTKTELARSYIAANPGRSPSYLARLLHADHPDKFASAEGARSLLRNSCKLTAGTSASPSPVVKNQVSLGADKGEATVNVKSLDIRSLEDALREARVDLDVWEVERWVVNNWEVTMGAQATGHDKPGTYTNVQVKVWLKRKAPTPMLAAFEGLLARASAMGERVHKPTETHNGGEHLLEISLFDHHWGMYAWKPETGNDYDIAHAGQRFLDGFNDLLDKAAGFKIEQILVPIGNDFFHINNPEGITKSGNKLDVDTRYQLVYETGGDAVVEAIERAAKIAPVAVLWVPGNHDPQMSYHLCRYLAAWFRHDRNVSVDAGPKHRKYFEYGKTLLGFAHGDKENHSKLTMLMVNENPNTFGHATTREWHLGHYHKEKETRYIASQSEGDVTVRILPSLCGTDAWHHQQGYVSSHKVAESYVYHRTEGLVSKFWTHAR